MELANGVAALAESKSVSLTRASTLSEASSSGLKSVSSARVYVSIEPSISCACLCISVGKAGRQQREQSPDKFEGRQLKELCTVDGGAGPLSSIFVTKILQKDRLGSHHSRINS
jgi:hypothetical protein